MRAGQSLLQTYRRTAYHDCHRSQVPNLIPRRGRAQPIKMSKKPIADEPQGRVASPMVASVA